MMSVQGISTVKANNADVPPGVATNNAGSSDGDGGGSLLSPPQNAGWDIGSQIAILLLESAKKARETAQKREDFDFESERQACEREIDSMHDEASTMREAAWVQGALDIGSGALQFASTAVNAESKLASSGAEQGILAGDEGATQLAEKARTLSTAGAGYAGGAKVLDAGSHTSAGMFSANELDARTRQKQDQQDARTAKKAGDDAHDAAREASDEANKILDFLREFENQKHSAATASLSGIRA